MKAHLPSVAAFFCINAALVLVAFFSTPPVLGSEKARPISSLSADERVKLPDSTQVTLKSGKTVTLGTLRAEHRARLERFAQAATLGNAAAGKLHPQPAMSMQTSPAAGTKGGSSTATNKPIIGRTGQVAPNLSPSSASLAPWFIPTPAGRTPKDYQDFCRAANPTVCMYLPANATLEDLGHGDEHNRYMSDLDYLIFDPTTCKYDGGAINAMGACEFWYPVFEVTNFTPTGPLDTKAACDPPTTYIVDPKGAIQVSYPHSGATITIGPSPITCVIQVWIRSK